MEQVPRLLRDMLNEMAELRKEIADLKEELKTRETE
jgi:Sec-independent protein translocase protein TatA